MKSLKEVSVSFGVILLAVLVTGCDKKNQAAAPPAVPVTVTQAVMKTMPLDLHAIGTVEAYQTVTIRPNVSGEITAVHFSEGQDVKKGQPLYTIDQRPFLAALDQAKGTLTRDQAQAEQARVEAARYTALLKEGVIAKEQYDQVVANAQALDATVTADKAAVETAKVNLDYCTISSPLNGRTGTLLMHQGNLVKANDSGSNLVVINQITPIYVQFSVPEQYLDDIRAYEKSGKLTVKAVVPGQEKDPSLGKLSLINNTVDPGTGTITLKGVFSNDDKRLWPGQFVTVVLTLADQPNQIVVPSQAVQTGQQGQYVFVVKGDTAENRIVQVTRTYGEQTIISSGVQPGEQVVTDGQSRLVPGAKVQIKTGGTPPAQQAQQSAGGAQ